MKNTDNAFSSIKQFGYLSLHIGGNRDSVVVFRLFSMYLKDKALNTSKTKAFLAILSNISYVSKHRKRR